SDNLEAARPPRLRNAVRRWVHAHAGSLLTSASSPTATAGGPPIPDWRSTKDMATASSLAWFFTNSAGLLVSRRSRSIAIRKTTTKRSAVQKEAFTAASVEFAREVIARGASVLVVGDDRGPNFPADLRSFRERTGAGIKVNL